MWLLLLIGVALGGDLRFAVTAFESGSADPAYAHLGRGLQSMLATDLSQSPQVELVERDRLVDLQRELDLAASDAVDPATAAQLGKLAGATHLLAGTVTVVDDTMRLDARLFGVTTGTTVLATSVTGERAAFFELEKDLARQLLDAVDVVLGPAERAELGRIHTANFTAFQAFSDGIGLADQQRFDEALDKLSAASAADSRFELATLTRAQVAAFAADMRAKAALVEDATAELGRVDHLARVGADGQLVARLEALAGDDALETRLTALSLLVKGLTQSFRSLRETEDSFALARRAEQAARRYLAQAAAAWPRAVPLPVSAGSISTDDFDEDFEDAKKRLFPTDGRPAERHVDRLMYLSDPYTALGLSEGEITLLWASLAAQVREAFPEAYATLSARRPYHLVDQLTAVLQLDRSNQALAEASAASTEPDHIRKYAERIEKNGRLQDALRVDPHGWIRERMVYGKVGSASESWLLGEDVLELLRSDTPAARHEVAIYREWEPDDDADEPMHLGGDRAWALAVEGHLATAARTESFRSDGWRWHSSAPGGARMVLGDAPLGDRTLRFDLTDRPPSDWWPRDQAPTEKGLAPPGQTLQWTVLFGLTDIHCPEQRQADGSWRLERRLRGWGIRVDGAQAVLVRVTDVGEDRFAQLAHDPVARAPLKRSTGPVSLSVADEEVRLTVGRSSVSFPLPEPVDGFAGFQIEGTGFVAMDGLSLEQAGPRPG